ncbi:MAG TPA: hypothetical protein VGY97_13020 [Solirubrobacteraceae bacterium]|jgi:hypothetical protein|nr:hypothetical protein [Solirubrobacteraceae bacterium]
MTTVGHASRVRRLLECLRPHVDEVVLAVNAADTTDTLAVCGDLADRRLRYQLPGSPSALIGWVQSQCSGEWLLRLDDDEAPSVEMLASLRELIADRRLNEIVFRRRWLYPDPGRYITRAPWRFDFQARLLRNLPAVWSFAGTPHTVGRPVPGRRLIDVPFYHADLVLSSLESRSRKSLDYEAEAPALIWNEFPVNGMYLPEGLDNVDTAIVPEADRPLVDLIVGPGEAPASPGGGPPVRDVPFTEVEQFNVRRTLPESAYRASVTFVDRPLSMPAAALQHFEVLVTNTGTERWPGGDRTNPLVQLGVRWRQPESGRIVRDIRQPFSEIVDPGETTRVVICVPTPFDPGPHHLEIGVVHLDVRWFEGRIATEVAIEPRREDAVTWGVPSVDHFRARELEERVARLEEENAGLRSELASVPRSAPA